METVAMVHALLVLVLKINDGSDMLTHSFTTILYIFSYRNGKEVGKDESRKLIVIFSDDTLSLQCI